MTSACAVPTMAAHGGGGPKVNGWVLILLQNMFHAELILRGSIFDVTSHHKTEITWAQTNTTTMTSLTRGGWTCVTFSNQSHSDEQATRAIISIVGIFFPHGLSPIS